MCNRPGQVVVVLLLLLLLSLDVISAMLLSMGLSRQLWPQLEGKQTRAEPESGANLSLLDSEWRRLLSLPGPPLERKIVKYRAGEGEFSGFLVHGDDIDASNQAPVVLLAHTAVGAWDDFFLYACDRVAKMGYCAFGMDSFGTGEGLWQRPDSAAIRSALVTGPRQELLSRSRAALNTALSLTQCDGRVSAIGFCFGGYVVLDMLRRGFPLCLTATVHGILKPPLVVPPDAPVLDSNVEKKEVLILHGELDPFVSSQDVIDLEHEMSSLGLLGDKIRIVSFPGCVHAFSRPEKTTPADLQAGLQYDHSAASASWLHLEKSLDQSFRANSNLKKQEQDY
jgi:dienelactone hydrolase